MKVISLALSIAFLTSHAFGKLQEMSWPMDSQHISYYPSYRADPALQYKYVLKGAGPFGHIPFVAYGLYSTTEHAGTHMDAPYHFAKNGKRIHEIPLDDLTGPLIVINISQRAKQSPDSQVELSDIIDWETKYGKIPERAFVLMHSGWDQHFGDDEKYLGLKENSSELHFPGIGGEASEWLIKNRDILGVGVDVVSCDPGNGTGATHLAVLPANRVCIENLRNVGKVPECGARFMMLPIMLMNGTGAQGRAYAEWYPGVGYKTSCKGSFREFDSLFDASNDAYNTKKSVMYVLIFTAGLYFWSFL